MATREGYADNLEAKRVAKKRFLGSVKGKVAATGLATALGLAGLGFLAGSQKTEENNHLPSPTHVGGVFPDISPKSTIISSPNPSEIKTAEPTQKPSPSTTESPIPNWAKEIPAPEWPINEVPISEVTKQSGRFVEFPTGNGSEYILSTQNPTIVAVEPDIENGLIWVALAQDGDILTRNSSAINVNGKDAKYYEYKGLTVWYKIDNSTQILKKNPEGSQWDTSPVGVGLDKVASHLKVGDILYGTLSLLSEGPQHELNNKTLSEIKSSIGKENVRDEKTFELYAQTVVLP